jgi:probable phosphoglycerate mutase
MSESLPEVYLSRHGEAEWTVSHQHTGRIDLPFTARGEENARRLRERLRGLAFDRVFVSPLKRARRTCELAGFGDRVVTVAGLAEWDYGRYRCLRTDEIRRQRPGWRLFRDGCPGGESVSDVFARADRVIGKLRSLPGPHPALRPPPPLPRPGRTLAGPGAGAGEPLRARHPGALRPRLSA